LLVFFLLPLVAALAPSEDFERGKNAFGRGEYRRAIEILRPLLYPERRLTTEGEVVQVHRMLGVAHLFEGQNADAKRELTELLRLRPDYRFDPLLDPPPVVDFFNSVLKEQDEEIARLEAVKASRRQADAERARNAERVVIERRFERRSFAVSFLPFGAGQFQNGQRTKGWAFFAAESALAVVSAGAFSTNIALYGLRPKRRCLVMQPLDAAGLPARCPSDQIDRSDERLSSALFTVQMAAGGLFFAVAAWGIVDAVIAFQSEVPIGPEVRRRETSPPGASAARWRFQPVLLGRDAAGAGLSGSF